MIMFTSLRGILLLVSTNCVTCTRVIRHCAGKFNVYASMNRVQRCYYGVGDVFVNRFIREITYIRVRVLLLKTSLTKDVHMQRVGRGMLLLWWIIVHCPFHVCVPTGLSQETTSFPVN